MKFLIVEDDRSKRLFLELFFKQKGYESYSFQSVQPAIKYAINHSNELDGIILDIGLTSYDHTEDYSYTRGLDLINELSEKGIDIPILINSSVYINLEKVKKEHNFTHIYQMDDNEWELYLFINRIKKQ